MKRVLSIVIFSFIFAVILFFLYRLYFSKNLGKGALQVTAMPESKVFLNDKLIGQTPFPKVDGQNIFQSGEYTLRLVPNDASYSPYEEKIAITKSTLTVVDHKFAQGGQSEGSVISLTPIENNKEIQLLVLSFPEKADVYVDSNQVGSTPLFLKNLTQSDHKLKIKKEGYREKLIPIRTPEGYKLQVISYLGIDTDLALPTPTIVASPSAVPTVKLEQVTIKQTPVGYLRVRSTASMTGSEVGRVKPGEVYEIQAEETGWYQIKLTDGSVGWVSGDYASKN